MLNKKYIIGISGALALVAILAATPASAQSTQGGPWQGGQGHSGMMGGPNTPRNGVFGTVASVSGNTLTVTSKGFGTNTTATTYTVDATNATVMKSGSASSVSAIAVGDTVMVQGTVSGTSVTATKINDGQFKGGMGRGMGMRPAVVGTVASVSGNTITVTSNGMGPNQSTTPTTYTVDATNATVMKNGATTTVASIAVGDTIAVQGTVSGTSVTATKIRDGVMQGNGAGSGPQIQGNGEPVLAGTVSSVSGSTITLTNSGNVTYAIDATNAKIQVKGNSSATVSNVSTGDKVIVQGTVNGTSVTATSVMDQGSASASNGNGSRPGGMGGFFGSIGNFFKNLFGF